MPTLILIRGLPGSAKTTLAKSLPGILVEADQFHTAPDGTYRFDGSKAGKAHKWCLETTEQLLLDGKDVIVANVFDERWQIRPYFELAAKLGVQVATLKASGQYESTHNVPSWVVDGMARRWQTGYGEPVTLEGIVVSVPKCTASEVVFRLDVPETVQSVSYKVYVRAPRNKLTTEPFIGEVWQVDGVYQPDVFFFESVNPGLCTRTKPTGKNLLLFLINHNRFHRVCAKTATRLYSKIPDLHAVLDAGEIEPFISNNGGKLSRMQAEHLLETWKEYTSELWLVSELNQLQLPVSLASRLLKIWGHEAMEKMVDDPYRLVALYPWDKVDKFAMCILMLDPYDTRRQVAAVEQVGYQHYDRGNTAIQYEVMSDELSKLLGYSVSIDDINGEELKNRVLHLVGDGIVQLVCSYTLEHFIKSYITTLLTTKDNRRNIGRGDHFDISKLRFFDEFHDGDLNTNNTINGKKTFKLSKGQGTVVQTVLCNSVYVIFGGLGVGKMTVLKTIFNHIDESWTIFPMALTATAAKAITDKTGYHAQTIAKFLTDALERKVPDNAWVFVTEASMLDLPTAFRLLKVLPCTARICLIGDQYQMPPTGPGLVLHPMYQSESIPQFELTEMNPQSDDYGIPAFAKTIRDFIFHKHLDGPIELEGFAGLKIKDFGVSFVEIHNSLECDERSFSVYNELCSFGTVKVIAESDNICFRLNDRIAYDHLLTRKYQNLACISIDLPVLGEPGQRQKATIGDQILWHGINDFNKKLYNGILGKLTEVFPDPICGLDTDGCVTKFIVEAEFDGEKVLLAEQDLYYVSLGYVVTCHKAQISQFERIIIVLDTIDCSDLCDNSWLYTAVTKAVRQVVIVGEKALFCRKLLQQSPAQQRLVGLRF